MCYTLLKLMLKVLSFTIIVITDENYSIKPPANCSYNRYQFVNRLKSGTKKSKAHRQLIRVYDGDDDVNSDNNDLDEEMTVTEMTLTVVQDKAVM